MAPPPMVEIVGLRSIRRDLKRLDGEAFGPAMIQAGLAVSEPLAERIRTALPKRSGNLARTTRAAKSRTGAAVRVGLRTVPYAGPIEFGGYPPGRRYVKDGRYIFPAARQAAPEAVRKYQEEIENALDRFNWSPPT